MKKKSLVLTCNDNKWKQKVLAWNENFSKNIPFGILTWSENAKLWEYEMSRWWLPACWMGFLFENYCSCISHPRPPAYLLSTHPVVSAGGKLLNIAKKNLCHTNKLTSSVDAIANSEIWQYYQLTDQGRGLKALNLLGGTQKYSEWKTREYILRHTKKVRNHLSRPTKKST